MLVRLAPGANLRLVDVGFHEMADLEVKLSAFDALNPGADMIYTFTAANGGPATGGP